MSTLQLIPEAIYCYLTCEKSTTNGIVLHYKLNTVFQIEAGWEYLSSEVIPPSLENANGDCSGDDTPDTVQLINIVLKEKPNEPTTQKAIEFDNLFPGVQQDNCKHKVVAQIDFLMSSGERNPSKRKTIVRTIDADANG